MPQDKSRSTTRSLHHIESFARWKKRKRSAIFS